MGDIVKARRDYTCGRCGRTISKGRTCAECSLIHVAEAHRAVVNADAAASDARAARVKAIKTAIAAGVTQQAVANQIGTSRPAVTKMLILNDT